MNDFTRDELILVACWSVNRLNEVGIDQATDEGTIYLSHKIQDMIMNYCDHEFRTSSEAHFKCTTCGVLEK
jgi:hypothetical protein